MKVSAFIKPDIEWDDFKVDKLAVLNNEQNQLLAGFNPNSPPKPEEKSNEFSSEDIKSLMEKFSQYFKNVDDYDDEEDEDAESKIFSHSRIQQNAGHETGDHPFLEDEHHENPHLEEFQKDLEHAGEYGHSTFWKMDPIAEHEKEKLILTLLEDVDMLKIS